MSQIALSPNAAGTGTFTLSSPATNTNRTLTLPDAAGTVFVNGQALSATTGSFSGDVTLGSSVLATPSGSAPSYTCRAWVNFNGTSSPGTIRASGNVSSVTRSATGKYVVNLTTAMPDANYAVTASIRKNDGTDDGNMAVVLGATSTTYSTSGFSLTTRFLSNEGLQNGELICAAVFR